MNIDTQTGRGTGRWPVAVIDADTNTHYKGQ